MLGRNVGGTAVKAVNTTGSATYDPNAFTSFNLKKEVKRKMRVLEDLGLEYDMVSIEHKLLNATSWRQLEVIFTRVRNELLFDQ